MKQSVHPELGSGSHPIRKNEMLKRVQHDILIWFSVSEANFETYV